MCELLVRVVTRPGQGTTATERGDVIVVAEDGWNWSARELSEPQWRILKLPGVAKDAAADLLLPDGTPAGIRNNMLLRARRNGLDLDRAALPAAFKAYLADDSRAAHALRIPVDVSLAALKVAKAALGG